MKTMLKETLILFAITLISGLALSMVYSVTKEPIREQEEKKKQEAYREVFTDAANFTEDEEFNSESATAFLHTLDEGAYADAEIVMLATAWAADGSVLGRVVTVTTHAGFGGDIKFVMGLRQGETWTVSGISVTEISETPGLGMRASEVLAPQFAGKSVDTQFSVTKAGATYPYEIDAISSATITSQAMTDAVNAGIAFLREWGSAQHTNAQASAGSAAQPETAGAFGGEHRQARGGEADE